MNLGREPLVAMDCEPGRENERLADRINLAGSSLVQAASISTCEAGSVADRSVAATGAPFPLAFAAVAGLASPFMIVEPPSMVSSHLVHTPGLVQQAVDEATGASLLLGQGQMEQAPTPPIAPSLPDTLQLVSAISELSRLGEEDQKRLTQQLAAINEQTLRLAEAQNKQYRNKQKNSKE